MRIRALAPFVLLILFGQTVWHARTASLTFDEGPHLAAGYTYLRTGDLRLQPVHIHPPLANIVAAAPLLLQPDLPDPRLVDGWEIASLSAVTDTVIWQYPYPDRLALAGRVPIILMTMLLGAVIFRWATDLFSPWGGVLALAFYSFDPNIIAHGSLVTTDMGVTWWGTLALFLTWRAFRPGSPRKRLPGGAGIALGLALASKVSALSLVPVLTTLWLLEPGRTFPQRLLKTVANLALSALALWAVYGFEVRPVASIPRPIPAATHLEIYRSLQEHYRLGHPAFLLGHNSSHGWWFYFPVAFVLKTPIPTLLLTAASIPMALRRLVGKSFLARWGTFLAFPGWYFVLTPFSSVNIGYRHLLPILPFLFIIASGVTASALRRTGLWSRLVGFAALFWLVAGTLRVAPHYLAFFNELAGGPANGYRYLVDSNLDWGQNLWELRDWMRAHRVERIFYAHFTPARPQVYGVQADFLPPDPRAVPFTPLDPAPGVYAIGATVLQGVYTPDVNTYAWFRTHEPVARLGYALFVYRVDPRPAPAWAVLCADPVPVLAPETVRIGLGQPHLRLISADCWRGWIWPAEGPGVFVFPAGAQPPPGTTLDLQARLPDSKPSYQIFRTEKRPSPAQLAEGVALEGPMAFLGISTSRSSNALEVETWWQVNEGPITRPFSIMAHLLATDGNLIGQADGLAVSPVELLPGDILVQRHRFEGITGTDFTLRTGAYWLDTMERWPVTAGGVPVEEIVVRLGIE